MIVVPQFQGDDMAIADLQHDVYGEALGIMVGRCEQSARTAITILGGDLTHPKWEGVERFDHRTLQFAHDLLAAVWRYETSPPQKRLPISEAPSKPELEAGTPERRWLKRLDSEVASWVRAEAGHEGPHMIQLVLRILAHQNEPAGYEAETRLAELIYSRFRHIYWDDADFRE